MDRGIFQQAYHGFLLNQSIENLIDSYFNLYQNNQKDKRIKNIHLLISSDNKEQALDFAQDTASLLSGKKSIKIFDLSSNNASEIKNQLEDIIVVNNFDVSIQWNDIKEAIDDIDKTIILCTTPSTKTRYQEDEQNFYHLFVKQIDLQPYTIEEICSASRVFFDELRKQGKVQSIEDSFYPALDTYVKTVYPRAVLQGKEFVKDLKERIFLKCYETKTPLEPLELSENTIPYYRTQEFTEDIEKNIQEYFCFSSDIQEILKNASDCAKLKHATGFTEYKPSINLNITGYSFEYVEKFVNIYARLLNSDKYNLIHAKDVTVMNLFDMMREKDNFNNIHGLIFLKDFEMVRDFSNANEVLEQLIQIINDEANDLAWVLYGEHHFDEMLNTNNATSLNEIFKQKYSLDKHNESSSEEYIKFCFKNKTFNNIALKVPSKIDSTLIEKVINKRNQKEATEEIEQYIVQNLEQLTAKTDTANTEDTQNVAEGKTPNEISKKNEAENFQSSSTKLTKIEETKKADTSSETKIETKEHTFNDVLNEEKALQEKVKNIKNFDSNEKNILLLSMSTLPKKISVNSYEYINDDNLIKGLYVSQLEPVPKMLAYLLANENKSLDAIYVLNTNKTSSDEVDLQGYANEGKKYNASEYFKERCEGLVKNNEIDSIDVEKVENEPDVESALYQLSTKLNNDLIAGNKINLYLDIHGGPRAPQTVVDAIVMLIKDIDNIELKNIYEGRYDLDKKKYLIKEATQDFKIFDFVSGIREFLSFGRSDNLVKFNEGRKETSDAFVSKINEISDGIVLNRMEKFSKNLNDLSDIVNKKDKEKGYYDTIKSLIRGNYKVSIGDKRFDLLDKESINFPAQLQWCLDKNLLQQALMLIENRTANVLYDEKILTIKTTKQEDGFGDWVKYSLASEIFYKKVNNKSVPIEVKWQEINIAGEIIDFDDKKILCYQAMTDRNWFNGIDALKLNDINKIKEKIKSKRIKPEEQYPTEYFKCIKKEPLGKKHYKKQQKRETKYAIMAPIPVDDVLAQDNNFLKLFYTLLYVYKNLKWYRNTVAHPEKISTNNDLAVGQLRAWIAFYIEIFMEVLDKSNEIMNESNGEQVSKKITEEQAKKNLEEKYPKKHSK